MKRFKPISKEQVDAMTVQEKLLAISGMHQVLHEKFRAEITKVIIAGITAAEEAHRDPREIVIVLAAKDDPFFPDQVRAKFEADYNAFWVYREALLESPPGKDAEHPYFWHWKEASEITDKGLKCLVIAYGACSVVNMEVEVPQEPSVIDSTAEVVPSDLDTGVDALESGTTLAST